MITDIDFYILNFIRENLTSKFGDIIMPLYTALGDYGFFYIAVALILVLFKKTRRAGVSLTIALAIGFMVCNLILKPSVARIRPYDVIPQPLLIPKMSDFSFPSGHTLHSFLLAACIGGFFPKTKIPLYVFAILMGFSRLYLYVHYPSDVIAGAILGIAIGYFSNAFVLRINPFIPKKCK